MVKRTDRESLETALYGILKLYGREMEINVGSRMYLIFCNTVYFHAIENVRQFQSELWQNPYHLKHFHTMQFLPLYSNG